MRGVIGVRLRKWNVLVERCQCAVPIVRATLRRSSYAEGGRKLISDFVR
jgi:hypothetical protein